MHRTRTLFITVAVMAGVTGGLHAIVPLPTPTPPAESAGGSNADFGKGIRDALSSYGALLNFSSTVTDEDVRAAAAELAQARENLANTEQQYNVGIVPQADLMRAQNTLNVAQAKLMGLQATRSRSDQRDALKKPVDVQVKNAPLRQVAEALSRASGVKVTVNSGISDEQKISLDARHVPLASVLEAVARQANLIIYPTGDGVALGPWPSLTVNGESRKTTFRNAPWSDDWVIPPTRFPGLFAAGGFGGGGMSLELPEGMNLTLPPRTDGVPSVLPPGGFTRGGVIGAGGFVGGFGNGTSVTSVGDRVVVAEPGRDKGGKPGVWLTVYRLVGDSLQQVSQTFHSSPAGEGESDIGVKPKGASGMGSSMGSGMTRARITPKE